MPGKKEENWAVHQQTSAATATTIGKKPHNMHDHVDFIVAHSQRNKQAFNCLISKCFLLNLCVCAFLPLIGIVTNAMMKNTKCTWCDDSIASTQDEN